MVDILIPQVGYYERDCLVLYNMLYFFERFGYTYRIVPHFDVRSIYRLKPKVLFTTDAHGHIFYEQFARAAKAMGILTVTLSSESNQVEDIWDATFWGCNKKKVCLHDLRFVWNQWIKDRVFAKYPDYPGRLEVSGAVGFDKYFFLDFVSRKDFLAKYGKKGFKKVIAYAGAAFSIYFNLKKNPKSYWMQYPEKEINKRTSDMLFVQSILEKLIEHNKDTLFILKKHPGKHLDDMEILEKWASMDNVVVMKYEENIYDLLHISDIWLSYESTTSIEAWIMKKPSIQIIPKSGDYDEFFNGWHRGNAIANSHKEVQNAIDEYYKTGSIGSFEKKSKARKRFLRQRTEKIDGLNGYRTALAIRSFLEKEQFRKISPTPAYFGHLLSIVRYYSYRLRLALTFIRKWDHFRERYRSFPQIMQKRKKYVDMVDRFIKKKGVSL